MFHPKIKCQRGCEDGGGMTFGPRIRMACALILDKTGHKTSSDYVKVAIEGPIYL